MLINIDAEKLAAARSDFSYPAVGLTGTLKALSNIKFNSHYAMEKRFHELLSSDDDNVVVLGLLSVIFWGHASGSQGVDTESLAMSRVIHARDGKKTRHGGISRSLKGIGIVNAATTVRRAKELISHGKCGEAVWLSTELPGIGLAFASKICAFIAPEECGVIDTVIVRKYPQFGFQVVRNELTRRSNADRYQMYCNSLKEKAKSLNDSGVHWTDNDGGSRTWRALDVERALYSI